MTEKPAILVVQPHLAPIAVSQQTRNANNSMESHANSVREDNEDFIRRTSPN